MPEPIPFPSRPARPPDDDARRRALDPARSFLVQAPAGSGKTHLLTQRFLRLLAQADRPDEIVAITFTIAAAAEMRQRILEALENAEAEDKEAERKDSGSEPPAHEDPLSIPALARAALLHSHQMHWQLLDQPGQLRILTIDAFCRALAMQAPLNWGLLSGLASLETTSQPKELYRRAARRLFERMLDAPSPARASLEALLLWRDNNWCDVESQIVEMLAQRNRWRQDFVFTRDVDFTLLRQRLEAPMRRAAHRALAHLSTALDADPGFREEILHLARAACESPGDSSPFTLAECAELPAIYHTNALLEPLALEDAISLYRALACFLLTAEGAWRRSGGLNVKLGFPPGDMGKPLKARMIRLLTNLAAHPHLESALRAFLSPLPTAYTEDEWTLVRHCFVVLREAWAELQLLFSETGQVDFIEIAQIAQGILSPSADAPTDSALRIADQIHHLLIDEFQDTSRNQHQLLSSLIALWPGRTHRTCFCVGDPMQSIYGFRDAEVELFERLKVHGLDLPGYAEPFLFDSITLQANFRTTPTLIEDLNQHFTGIFPSESAKAGPDDVAFAPAAPTRAQNSTARAELYLDFTVASRSDAADYPQAGAETTRQSQLDRILALVQRHLSCAEAARRANLQAKYRIAILGRTRSTLVRIAEALRTAQIPFRAVELVPLRERSEILDALALARAFLNPADRRAWLAILRSPWCGLSLSELHALVSADDAGILGTSVPTLLRSRLPLLLEDGKFSQASGIGATRLARVFADAQNRRAEAATLTLGTWLESIWKALGGPATVNAEARANLDLLWKTLDTLPSGEAGLLSSELDSALDGLYALPDPSASDDHGVQLMTIHQSKGLEFEIVLIPELEAATRSSTPTMISWLERGLPTGSESEGPTEFLIAPIQSKGSEAGHAKRWVDCIRREREAREMRRLLYVASTRAREELHLFARPCFNPGKTGRPSLAKATGLLSTAWPAFGARIEAEFESWLHSQSEAMYVGRSLALAAHAEVPSAPAATRLYRLPAHFTPVSPLLPTSRTDAWATSIHDPAGQAYQRTPGGLYSRLQGVAIHAILEELTRLRQTLDGSAASAALEAALPRVTTLLRSRGLSLSAAASLAQESLALARDVLADPIGAWILTHHPHASAESRWSGLIAPTDPGSSGAAVATLRHLRPDRIFLARPHPSLNTIPNDVWWIIDYKTSHTHLPKEQAAQEAARRTFLESHRAQHSAQLEAYAQLLRGLTAGRSGIPREIRAGLFYPRLLLFDTWPL